MKYAVVIEKGPTSYGAYAPDLPGCGAAAETRDQVIALINEAIPFHIEGLVENGDPVPEPHMSVDEAMAHHITLLAGDGESVSELGSTSVVEVEVSLPQPAAGLAGHGVGGA